MFPISLTFGFIAWHLTIITRSLLILLLVGRTIKNPLSIKSSKFGLSTSRFENQSRPYTPSWKISHLSSISFARSRLCLVIRKNLNKYFASNLHFMILLFFKTHSRSSLIPFCRFSSVSSRVSFANSSNSLSRVQTYLSTGVVLFTWY